jgi:hypothetical protein
MRPTGDHDGADKWLRLTVAIGEFGEPSRAARHRIDRRRKGGSRDTADDLPGGWRHRPSPTRDYLDTVKCPTHAMEEAWSQLATGKRLSRILSIEFGTGASAPPLRLGHHHSMSRVLSHGTPASLMALALTMTPVVAAERRLLRNGRAVGAEKYDGDRYDSL